MKSEILTRFDMPILPLTGLCIFVALFVAYVWWTFRPANKKHFDDISNIPFKED